MATLITCDKWDNRGKPFAPEIYTSLTFGGVTAFTRAPASGENKEEGRIVRDQIIILEVMSEEIDYGWSRKPRSDLRSRRDCHPRLANREALKQLTGQRCCPSPLRFHG